VFEAETKKIIILERKKKEVWSGKNSLYAPMIYTAPFIMFWMRAYPLRGQVGGGWAREIESFLGLVKWHRADMRVPFWPQKRLQITSLDRYLKTTKTVFPPPRIFASRHYVTLAVFHPHHFNAAVLAVAIQ
jgi:hypothetical protein